MRVPDYFDRADADERPEWKPTTAQCKRCKATDVRWRQQGGKWVLFSLKPGVLHKCPTVSAQEDFKRA